MSVQGASYITLQTRPFVLRPRFCSLGRTSSINRKELSAPERACFRARSTLPPRFQLLGREGGGARFGCVRFLDDKGPSHSPRIPGALRNVFSISSQHE